MPHTTSTRTPPYICESDFTLAAIELADKALAADMTICVGSSHDGPSGESIRNLSQAFRAAARHGVDVGVWLRVGGSTGLAALMMPMYANMAPIALPPTHGVIVYRLDGRTEAVTLVDDDLYWSSDAERADAAARNPGGVMTDGWLLCPPFGIAEWACGRLFGYDRVAQAGVIIGAEANRRLETCPTSPTR